MSLDGISTTPANTTLYAHVINATTGHRVGQEIAVTTGGSINLPDLAPGAYFVWIRPQYPAATNLQATLRSYFGDTALGDGVSRCTWVVRDVAQTGTYVIRVAPYYPNLNFSATLTVAKAVSGTLLVDQPFNLNLDAPGRPARLTFSTAGVQHLSLNIGGLNATPAGSSVTVQVQDSFGKDVGIRVGSSTELHSLPMGTYSVWITQPLAMTGSMQVTLRSTPVAPDGASLNINLPPGQSSYFTFDAVAGESIGVALTDVLTTPARDTNFAYVVVYEPGARRRRSSALCMIRRPANLPTSHSPHRRARVSAWR